MLKLAQSIINVYFRSSDEEGEGEEDKKKKKKQKVFKIKDERDLDFQEKFDDDEGMDDAEDAVTQKCRVYV